MNDRYLYRAKRTDNGEWVEGSLITGVFFRLGQEIPYMFCPNLADYDCFEDFSEENGIFEVDPSTICQCTGLKDKNGNLIWENDIVKHDFGKDQIGVQLAIVKYDSKYACYQIKPIYDWMYCDKTDCEVIGNIFDNPELLEVGE